MISKTLVITNQIGFHARPAALLVETAKKYLCTATISKGEGTADMHSMVEILRLKAKLGDEVTVTMDGDGEEEAMNAVVELIHAKFGEE